jgi:hypothetical protein
MAYRYRVAETAAFAGGINLLAGLWLIISPWVFGYANQPGALWNSIVIGIAITILAGSRQLGAASGWSWVNSVLGAWIIASPFVFDYVLHAGGTWNSIIVGLIVVVLGATSGLSGEVPAELGESTWGDDERGEGHWSRPSATLGAWPRHLPATADYRGRGPRGYTRSDEQIRADVCDRMAEHPLLDAGDIDVIVDHGEVRLQGTVGDRRARRLAEDIADSVAAVRDVRNELHIRGVSRPEGPRRAA